MLKKDFINSLSELSIQVHELMLCDSVPFDSATYVLLQTTYNCLRSALDHSNDFNRDKL